MFFFLMVRQPPCSARPDTPFPYTPRFRSRRSGPTARVLEDELAHLALGVGLRMPQLGADETLARFQVDVERWRGQLAPAIVEQARTLPALVRRFVAGETGVALEPEQRTDRKSTRLNSSH